MRPATQAKFDAVDAGHDWEIGRTHSGGGTSYSRDDRCRFCGLVRHWHSDSQNGIADHYRFADASDGDIPLRDVPDACMGDDA